MTTFEKDCNLSADELSVVLRSRKAELVKLEREGRCCRNSFRRTCIAQEYAKLCREYAVLDSMI